MNFTVFLSVLFALQIVCLYVGAKIAKKMSDQNDYFLAGKGVGFFPLLMTFIATQIGGGTVLGATEEAFNYGWYVLLYPLGCCLGFVLLAAGLARKMYKFKVSTIAQIFEVAYGSAKLKKCASLLSIVSLFMIFVGQIIASKKFMLSLGYDQEWIFAVFWTIVIIYTVIGGLQAVVATDILQALFFMAIFFVCFGYVALTNTFSVPQVIESGLAGETFTFNSDKFCGWLLMPLLFMVIEQDMGQRCFAAKSAKVVVWASAIAAICIMTVCIIPIYMGILGKTAGIDIPAGASVLMTVSQAVTTPTLSALMGVAVLAAIVSTADSLINAISSNLTQDFELPMLKQNVRAAQIVTALISLIGIAISYFFNNVVDLLILSYELSISCLFVSVFMAMLKGTGKRNAAILSIVLGAIGFVVFRMVPTPIPKEIASLLLSAVGYVIGEVWAREKTPVQA